MLYTKTVASPVGPLKLIASDKGLSGLLFHNGRGQKSVADVLTEEDNAHPLLRLAEKQLQEYFQGKRTAFDIPLDPQGTVFQQKVWKVLRQIPYAETISYGEQARRMGDAKKARAVGMANGRNPISIIVPCHRVIGTSGDLTGFGGGLKTKKFLLDHERAVAAGEKKATPEGVAA